MNKEYAETNPDETLKMILQYMKMGKTERRSLGEYSRLIACVAQKHPKKAAKAFETLQPLYGSFMNHDAASLSEVCRAVGDIVKADSDLSKKGVEAIGEILKHDTFRDYHIIEGIKSPIQTILENKPELAGEILRTVKEPFMDGVQKNEYSVSSVGEIAESIVEADPRLADETTKFVSKALEFADKDDELDIEAAKDSLTKIADMKNHKSDDKNAKMLIDKKIKAIKIIKR